MNLLEYALKGDPTNDAAGVVNPLLGSRLSIGGTNWIEFIHLMRKNDPGLAYIIECRTNLLAAGSWADSPDAEVIGESAPVDNYVTVTNRVPADKDAEYIRLRITR